MRFTGFLLLTLILVSCGAESGRFRIEGRFRNLNQGEFYVYSRDGATDGMDTIKVADGRFAYETDLERPATFVIVFPNFSEQAVFGEPGATATISGDVSNLKEMEIEGTDDNELMTDLRMRINKLSPPEITAAVEEFVRENPASSAAMYAVERYIIMKGTPDYGKAYELTALMIKANNANRRLAALNKQLKSLQASRKGGRPIDFRATDTDGKIVDRAMMDGKVNIVCLWASWNYDSQAMLRRIKGSKKKYGADMSVMSISVDARAADCNAALERDSVDWPNICDGRMWDSPVISSLGLSTVPGNIVFDAKGKVIASNLTARELEEKTESILK